MIRVSSCERCGDTRVERDGVVACLGCGDLKWPGGVLYFSACNGRSAKLEVLITLMRRPTSVSTDALLVVLYEGRIGLPSDPTKVLHQHIHHMRRLLVAGHFPGRIETTYTKGYRLVMSQPVVQQRVAA